MNAEEMMTHFQGQGYEVRLQEHEAGIKNKVTRKSLYVTVDRDAFHDAVEHLIEVADPYPHFCIISTADMGDTVELNYHFTLDWGGRLQEYQFTFKLTVPKSDLVVRTITDLVPAVVFSEREIREMMGVEFDGLTDKRHLFLTPEFPEGVYPWRRDETAPPETNKLYEGWKP
jgi:membrane-bound hydrogenase subunit beta